MSATEQMRQMLDQLMGTAREGENQRSRFHFTDSRVCKSFLLDCCPHDIFASTRMDLGECDLVHDLALRADYEKASADRDYGFEMDAYEHLHQFVTNADRKTELAKKRLAETQEELSGEVSEKLNKVHELAEQIGKKLAEAEKEGAEGNVEKSLTLMEEVEQIKKQKIDAENEYKSSIPTSNFQKQKLRVCEVCSAYLGIYDNDRRLADHFGGKLHLGFITIREKYDQLKQLVANKRKEVRSSRRDPSPDRRDRGRGNRRDDRRRDDGRGSGGNRDRSRERRRRSRSRSPTRGSSRYGSSSYHHSRSRSNDRYD